MPSAVASEVTEHDPPMDVRPAAATVAVLLPTVGTALTMMALFFTVGTSPVPNAATLVYGLANFAVLAGVYGWLSSDARPAVFRYGRPSGAELAGGVGLAVVGVGVVAPVVVRAADAFGVSGGPSVATLQSPAGALVVGVSAVLIAPVAEEVLFRGLLFGTLFDRYGGRAAVVGSSAVFGLIHVFLSGLPGVVESFVIGLGFALLRYRYDNLVGAGVAHALINAYYVAAGLGVLPSLV